MSTQNDGIYYHLSGGSGSEDRLYLEGILLFRPQKRADDEYIAVGSADKCIDRDKLLLRGPDNRVYGYAALSRRGDGSVRLDLALGDGLRRSIDAQGGLRLLAHYRIGTERRYSEALHVGVNGEIVAALSKDDRVG